MTEKDGHKIWDVDRLFEEILTGMKKCSEIGKMPYSIGIDTWAVDFVLLDNDDRKIMDAVAYRDDRTAGIDKKVYEVINRLKLKVSSLAGVHSYSQWLQEEMIKRGN